MGLETYRGRISINLESKELAQEIMIACKPIYELKHDASPGGHITLQGDDFPTHEVSSLHKMMPVFIDVIDAYIKRTDTGYPLRNLYQLHLHIWQKKERRTEEKQHVRFEGYEYLRPSYVHISGVGEAYPFVHDGDPSGRGSIPHRGIQIRFISMLHQGLSKSFEALLSDSKRLDEIFRFYTHYFG